ncbi:hypothetical protein, partial [Streptococcus suis]|uniref:hypothetical protein n=1 Tax=Streptococcus suis TaxID=1307 RepID=UPI001EE071A8
SCFASKTSNKRTSFLDNMLPPFLQQSLISYIYIITWERFLEVPTFSASLMKVLGSYDQLKRLPGFNKA